MERREQVGGGFGRLHCQKDKLVMGKVFRNRESVISANQTMA